MLMRKDLFGEIDLEELAIMRLQEFEPAEGYYFANSFGKDSGVVRHLMQKAGVLDRATVEYNWTTVDPPELLQHGRKHCPETAVILPERTMWQLIPAKRMPPTRIVRYCCQVLKEGGGAGRVVATGVRWAESYKRSKRRMVEFCNRDASKKYLHPIIEWTEDDVWRYTRQEGIPYCGLYDEGFKRLGCIGCPMQGPEGMKRDFSRWPKHHAAYIRSFQRMVDERKRDGLETQWNTGEEVMLWWLAKRAHQGDPDQTVLFE